MHQTNKKLPVFNPWWPNSNAGHQLWLLVLVSISIISAILEYFQTSGYDFVSRVEDAFPGMIIAAGSSAVGWYILLVIFRFCAVWLSPSLREGFDEELFSPTESPSNREVTARRQVAADSHRPVSSVSSNDSSEAKRNSDDLKDVVVKIPEIPRCVTPPQVAEEILQKKKGIKLHDGAENAIPNRPPVAATATTDSPTVATLIVLVMIFGPLFLVAAWILGEAFFFDKKLNGSQIGGYLPPLIVASPGFLDLSDSTDFKTWFNDSGFIIPKNCRLVGVYDSIACFVDKDESLFSVPLAFLGQADIAEMRQVDKNKNLLFSKQLPPLRMWTDASGGYQKELRIIGIVGTMVALEGRNGAVKLVPFYELADADIEYIALVFPNSRSQARSLLRKR